MQRTDYFNEAREIFEDEFICELLASAPGGGKTTAMLAEMATKPAAYLLAVPRIDLLAEHVERLRMMASAAGRAPTIIEVHSRTPGTNGKVERRLRDTLSAITTAHTIVVTTHAALISLAPGEVTGFHVRVDELPEAAIVSGQIGLALMWHSMAARYTLSPGSEAGWFRLSPRPDAEPIGLERALGGVGRELVELHRLACSRGRVVEVDIAAWADAGVPERSFVRWRSIWTLAALRGAVSLKMAAAGYEHSFARYALEGVGGIRVHTVQVGGSRTGQPRIRIRYFTRHAGSTGWWQTKDGRACLVAISRHLETTCFSGYWAGNGMVEPYFTGRLLGSECKPKLAGTNSLRDHTSCAMVYSAKATPDDEAIIAALALNPDAVRAAREDEDVFQFACRGAIRDPAYGGPYEVFVYDLGQAERLRDRLLDGGFTDVALMPVVEAGIVDIERQKAHPAVNRPAPLMRTADQRQNENKERDRLRKREQRARVKATKVANGTYRGRGRPRRLT